jgi:hypothetical protein
VLQELQYPARGVAVLMRMARKRLFIYDVKQSRLIRIEAVCEYRASSDAPRGK